MPNCHIKEEEETKSPQRHLLQWTNLPGQAPPDKFDDLVDDNEEEDTGENTDDNNGDTAGAVVALECEEPVIHSWLGCLLARGEESSSNTFKDAVSEDQDNPENHSSDPFSENKTKGN